MKISDIILNEYNAAQYGWIYGKFGKEGYSDEFIECLKLYTIEAHGQWYDRNSDTAKRIDAAFQKEMPVMQESHWVYRAWCPDYIADESDFRKRDRISFPWYISCSTEKLEAEYYMVTSGSVRMDAPVIMMEIDTKPGARGIVLSDFYKKHGKLGWMEDWSGEVILDRNAEFDVLTKTKGNDWNPDYDSNYKYMRENGLEVWEVGLNQVK